MSRWAIRRRVMVVAVRNHSISRRAILAPNYLAPNRCATTLAPFHAGFPSPAHRCGPHAPRRPRPVVARADGRAQPFAALAAGLREHAHRGAGGAAVRGRPAAVDARPPGLVPGVLD